MWKMLEAHFRDAPAKLKVLRTFVELGLRVEEDGKVYLGDVEVPDSKIARAVGVDRRVVREAVKSILGDASLKRIFKGLKPAGAMLRDVASLLGYGVVEIRAKPEAVGIIAEATALIAKEGISIRQIIAEDPELYPDPKLTIITDKPLPGDIIPKFLKIPTVKQVAIS